MVDRPTSRRIAGYDLARSIAILGMVVHHFEIAMTRDAEHPKWLSRTMTFFDGRPATLFLILAGVGMTLFSRRAVEDGDPVQHARVRATLLKRGVLLFVLGFMNLLIWPGDILRVYGVSLLLASCLFDKSNRWLLSIAFFFVLGFGVLLISLNYEQNWDWSTMTYHGLWTPAGLVRNLFFDGFRSVFPWCGFLFFGMWLGRLDLSNRITNSRCLIIGLSLMLAAETTSAICLSNFQVDHVDPLATKAMKDGVVTKTQAPSDTRSAKQAEIQAVFGTDSMPPLPLFLTAAGGLALFIIALCVRIADHWPESLAVKSLSATGQMALTWYFAHIYLGLGTLVACDLIGNQSLVVAAISGCGFFLLAVAASSIWKERYSSGPLEGILRQLTG